MQAHMEPRLTWWGECGPHHARCPAQRPAPTGCGLAAGTPTAPLAIPGLAHLLQAHVVPRLRLADVQSLG